MDVLSDVLRVVRLTGSIFFTADLYAPWSVSSPHPEELLRSMPTEAECVSLFHIITEGGCWFKTDENKTILLKQGSVIIFPHGRAHIMGSDIHSTPVSVMKLLKKIKELPGITIEYGGKGPKTQFVCGYLLCDQRFNPLLGAIPDVIIVSPHKENEIGQESENSNELLQNTLSIESDSWLGLTLKHLAEEVRKNNEGGATLITRLTELMYVEVLRRYMKSLPPKSKGWLAGIRDPEIGKALKYLHNYPDKKWDVEQLASQAGVSRSAFAQRFTDLIGMSPIQYLTGWRMQLARNLLLQPNLSIAMVAEKVGYDSDIAFSRAFKRYVGTPPAEWKEQAMLSQ